MLSRSIKNLTNNQLITRSITTSSTLPKKVYQRTTTNKSNSTLKPTTSSSTPTPTTSTTTPIVKKVTKPIIIESITVPEVKSTPNWSSADEFDHQLEFSSANQQQPGEEIIINPLPEIPLRSTRSTPSASSSVIPALTDFPNAPFPSASTLNLSTPLAPLHSSHSLERASTPLEIPIEQKEVDWTTSFHGISSQPFSREAAEKLMRPLIPAEIEIKPG